MAIWDHNDEEWYKNWWKYQEAPEQTMLFYFSKGGFWNQPYPFGLAGRGKVVIQGAKIKTNL
jgi:hypothetical protein